MLINHLHFYLFSSKQAKFAERFVFQVEMPQPEPPKGEIKIEPIQLSTRIETGPAAESDTARLAEDAREQARAWREQEEARLQAAELARAENVAAAGRAIREVTLPTMDLAAYRQELVDRMTGNIDHLKIAKWADENPETPEIEYGNLGPLIHASQEAVAASRQAAEEAVADIAAIEANLEGKPDWYQAIIRNMIATLKEIKAKRRGGLSGAVASN